MNYRHAFHAGNHADVLKHAVLLLCLAKLSAKPAPLTVLDTHAGRGLYDLASPEAARSPEWRLGVDRLWNWAEAPDCLQPYLRALRQRNPSGELRWYPGSPLLAKEFLRAADRLVLCEMHPEEAAALREVAGEGAQVHQRDGFGAFAALLPPATSRALVLLDPPYEQPNEVQRCVLGLAEGIRRFRQGVYLWWRPLKEHAWLDAAEGELSALVSYRAVRIDLRVAKDAEGLAASSLLLINPPFGTAEAAYSVALALSQRLARGVEAGVQWKVIGQL